MNSRWKAKLVAVLLALITLAVLASWLPDASRSPIWHFVAWTLIVLIGIWTAIGLFCPWLDWVIDKSDLIPGPAKPTLIQGIFLFPFIIFLRLAVCMSAVLNPFNDGTPND